MANRIIDAWARVTLEDKILEKMPSITADDKCVYKVDKVYKECYDCIGYNKQCVNYLPKSGRAK